MTIYIESFLIQNILIDYCLILLVKTTTKSKTTIWKMIFSSVIGASFSVFSAIIIQNVVLMNIVKFVCAFCMILIAFKTDIKHFIFNFILLFIYTYALGGAIINLTSTTYSTGFGMVMSSKFSLEIICLVIICLTYLFQFITKQIKFKIKTNNLIYPITLFLNNNKVNLNAYLDTGNLLNYQGNPVVVVDVNTYLQLTKTSLIDFYLSNTDKVSTSTVNGTNNLRMIKLDKMIIKEKNKNKTIENQYIAVSTQFKATNYQALLSPGVI